MTDMEKYNLDCCMYHNSDLDVKTVYDVEYIANERDYRRLMDDAGRIENGMIVCEPWECYSKRTFDNLQYAMNFFMCKCSDEFGSFAKLCERVLLDDDIVQEKILESPICASVRERINKEMEKSYWEMRKSAEELEKSNKMMREYIEYTKQERLFEEFLKMKSNIK